MGKTAFHDASCSLRRRSSLAGLALTLAAVVLLLSLPFGNLSARAGTPSAPKHLDTVQITIEPSPASVHVGESITLEVQVQNAPALGGMALHLQFDTAYLEVVETTPGVLIDVSGYFTPTQIFTSSVNNSAGSIVYEAARGVSPFPSGEGTLIRVTFNALQEGTAAVQLLADGTSLITPDGLTLPLELHDGTVNILPAVTCRDVIGNGSFESSIFSPWQASGYPVLYHSLGYESSSSAWLGGYNNAADALVQRVTIPDDATSASLSYWVFVQSQASGEPLDPLDADDLLQIEIRDLSNNLLAILATHDGTELGASVSDPLDLITYRGQTINLRFYATCDEDIISSFFIDTVTLDICRTGEWPSTISTYLPLVMK